MEYKRKFVIKDKFFEMIPRDDNDLLKLMTYRQGYADPPSLISHGYPPVSPKFFTPRIDVRDVNEETLFQIWDPLPDFEAKYHKKFHWKITNCNRDLRLFQIVPEDRLIDFQKLIDSSPNTEPLAVFFKKLYEGVKRDADWHKVYLQLPPKFTIPDLTNLHWTPEYYAHHIVRSTDNLNH